jgi:transposase
VPISAPYSITNCRRFFAEPATPRQRQYEALRAFYLEGLTSAHAAARFGYSPGAFRVLCHAFRRGELPEFFAATRPGPRDQPKKSAAQERIIALRKRNYSVYDISRTLKQQGTPLSATAVREVLAAQGFAPLPRRLDEERPVLVGPTTEAVADVRSFTLAPREFTTRMGGLFLFIPDLVRFEFEALAVGAKLPGSRMIPAAHALRASLALKLWAIERKSHVMALVADEGLALFCGLNAMPKRSFLAEYSSQINPQKVSRLTGLWHEQLTGEALLAGQSLNLDFHSVPYFGEHPVVESHYLAKRSRRQPSILAFLAQDADSQVFCLRQRRHPQGRGGRRGLPFHRLLDRSPWRPASPPGVRLQAHDLPRSRPARSSRHHLLDPAPPLAKTTGRDRPAAAVGLAHHHARCAKPQVPHTANL